MMIWFLGLCKAPEGSDWPSQGELIPRDSKWFACEHTVGMQANQSGVYMSNHLLFQNLTLQSIVLPAAIPGYFLKMNTAINLMYLNKVQRGILYTAEACIVFGYSKDLGSKSKIHRQFCH